MSASDVRSGDNDEDAVAPYSMHVSAKYLELTRKKLESARLPRELDLPEQRRWDMGTPKAVLEPLLDFWLERYDWREQEAHLNSTLPQFRTTITMPFSDNMSRSESLRMHFVHKPSNHKDAIPLLYCHTWPASFIEIEKIIDALTDPHSLPGFGHGAQQAFHVIAPSIPGHGFSDASSSQTFGLSQTAQAYNTLMLRLGYDSYVAHGTGWGFGICRALALNHSRRCIAVHTANPKFLKPRWETNKAAVVKYHVAKVTQGRIPFLSFGYLQTELRASRAIERASDPTALGVQRQENVLGALQSNFYTLRPQSLAYSWCDSPVGLLAGLLDILHTRTSTTPLSSRSRSPFLSPVELEVLESQHERSLDRGQNRLSTIEERPESAMSPPVGESTEPEYIWTATEILNWTMMQWLPGPEASLRWLRQAHIDSAPRSAFTDAYCSIPLGISSFRSHGNSTPLAWGSETWDVAWVKRHQQPASLPAWEAPDLLVLDMRECFGAFLSHGLRAKFPIQVT